MGRRKACRHVRQVNPPDAANESTAERGVCMTVSYEASYEGQLRRFVGSRKLVLPSVRAVIRDEEGRLLFVRRRDDGTWAMPAGGLELDEAPLDALRREVREETGLQVESAVLLAVDSFTGTNQWGNTAHRLVFVFLVDRWSGDLQVAGDETLDARFFALHETPETEPLYEQTLEHVRRFTGTAILGEHRYI